MAQVKPIPDGYHAVTPQLVFHDAAKAIEWYQKAFGAKETSRMLGPGGKIWHAEMQIGDSKFFLNDAMPGMPSQIPSQDRPSPTSIMLYVPNVDEIHGKAVGAGGKEFMGGVQDMFWGDRAGTVIDPFGYAWFIATHVRDMTAEEAKRAREEAVRKAEAQMGNARS